MRRHGPRISIKITWLCTGKSILISILSVSVSHCYGATKMSASMARLTVLRNLNPMCFKILLCMCVPTIVKTETVTKIIWAH